MKLIFDEIGNNFLEIKKIDDNVIIILSSQDGSDKSKTIINSVKITYNEFKELIKDIG